MPEGEEGVRLAIEALPDERRKQARHGCGYALWVEAINHMGDSVIVDHRSAEPGALPLVLSIIPLFNIFLAAIDVDLMREKGIVPTLAMAGQPKSSHGYATGYGPQVSYPSMPAPPVTNGKQQGGQNALKSWWAGQRASASSQSASSNGAGIP